MKAHHRRVARNITIASFLIVPSSTADTTSIPTPVPHPASAGHIHSAAGPRNPSLATSRSADEPTREEKTIAWLILLLKQGRGLR